VPRLAEANLSNFQIRSYLPQLAAVALVADYARVGMAGKEKFDNGSPGLQHFGGFGINHHPRGDRGETGSEQGPCGLILHQANAAGTYGDEMGIVAQRGNMNAILLSEAEDRYSRSAAYLYFTTFPVFMETWGNWPLVPKVD